jgi:hypothetical protein
MAVEAWLDQQACDISCALAKVLESGYSFSRPILIDYSRALQTSFFIWQR